MYWIYVVQLADEAWDEKDLKEANPQLDNDDVPISCVYVGASSQPAKRVAEHLAGERSNRLVQQYFQRADYRVRKAFTWEKAKEIEEEIARELREKGHAVYSKT